LEESKVGIRRGDPVPGALVERRVVPPSAERGAEVPAEHLHNRIMPSRCDSLDGTE
jgi:hypothetical protein